MVWLYMFTVPKTGQYSLCTEIQEETTSFIEFLPERWATTPMVGATVAVAVAVAEATK